MEPTHQDFLCITHPPGQVPNLAIVNMRHSHKLAVDIDGLHSHPPARLLEQIQCQTYTFREDFAALDISTGGNYI